MRLGLFLFLGFLFVEGMLEGGEGKPEEEGNQSKANEICGLGVDA